MNPTAKIKKPRALPESQKDIHTEHCCVLHGCHWGQEFYCTVVKGQKPQSFVCGYCARRGIINLDMVRIVQAGGKPHCPYCSHTLP
jgi:uncharacterized Zn-finger protein